MNSIALVVVRPNSSRLPNKHNRIIGDRTSLDWTISRLTPICDLVIICTTEQGLNAYSTYQRDGVIVHAPISDENLVVTRLIATAKTFKSKQYVIVSGDCPLISTSLVKQLISTSNNSKDFDVVNFKDEAPHVGVEVVKRSALLRFTETCHLSSRLQPNINTIQVMKFLESNIVKSLRLTLDNFADLAFHREAYTVALNHGRNYDYEAICDLINDGFTFNKLNEHVTQKPLTHDVPRTIFSTRSNSKIGVGHLSRCIALAQYYNEIEHRSVHFHTNDDLGGNELLNRYGYECDLDYHHSTHFLVLESDFHKYDYIHDRPGLSTIDWYNRYFDDPTYGVNLRLNYIPNPIKHDVVYTFGMGKWAPIGKDLANRNNADYVEGDILPHLKGANKVVTAWSQTAREALYLGKEVEVYSGDDADTKLCKHLESKGVLKWKGQLNKI
jgi:spore coat polysaccharide biosynthesis protein SpsF (cytidylyltransferase family)